MKSTETLLAASLIVFLGSGALRAQDSLDLETPVRTVLDPSVIPTRQTITPAGMQTVFEGRVWGVAFGRTNNIIYVLTAARHKPALVYELDWRTNRVLDKAPIEMAPGIQAIAFDPLSGGAITSGIVKASKGVQMVRVADGKATVLKPILGTMQDGGLTVRGHTGLAALTYDDQLAIVDLDSAAVKKVKTGIAPFGVTANAAGTVAYVSNWGEDSRGPMTSPPGRGPHRMRTASSWMGVALRPAAQWHGWT